MKKKNIHKYTDYTSYIMIALCLLAVLPATSYGDWEKIVEKNENIETKEKTINSETAFVKARTVSAHIKALQDKEKIDNSDKWELIKEFNDALTEIKKVELTSNLQETEIARDEIQKSIEDYIKSSSPKNEVIAALLDSYSMQMTEELIRKSVEVY